MRAFSISAPSADSAISAKAVASRVAYPAVILAGLLLHWLQTALGVPATLSAYAVVFLGALAVSALETLLPARASWKPSPSDLRIDATYMALVQGALPVALGLAASTFLSDFARGFQVSRLWPHGAPLLVQALLMVLAADFLRYWLHVASHRNALLWRLHSVHHRPGKLYWLNVGRFHPVEKTLQYGLDALPFALLGVGKEVLASYFVFYALNGFFQHANTDVRLGWLNYVVSGPELHRWHHSRNLDESLANYGNNLIVWDLLFGTRFLPERRVVGELGHLDGDVALAPGLLFRLRMWMVGETHFRSFARAARRPREAQLECLRRILRTNRDTRFGIEHRFSEIDSIETFRARVPLQDYESLRPYVEEQMRSGSRALTAGAPSMYARTSGTTGLPKLVPVLRETLEGLSRRQLLSTFSLFRARPHAYGGRILAIVGSAVEERLATGVPVGSASGHLYETMPALARRKYVLPHEVFGIEDYELKYLLILRLGIAEKNVTLAGSANPSTFLKLGEVLRASRDVLLEDVERETFGRLEELSPEVRRAVAPRLRCSKLRRRELRLLLGKPEPRLADLWPHLKILVTWTGGSAGLALERLRHELREDTLVTELGYLASELSGTVNAVPEENLCVPLLRDHFYELVERGSLEAGKPVFVTLDEAREGREYYVVVTTSSGLYRYFMNDIVRVTGFFEGTPALAFLQKGKGTTNITGEKLSESQVLRALELAGSELGLGVRFFVMLADPGNDRYRLFVESEGDGGGTDRLARRVEEALYELNVEYRAKRASGRLGPLEARFLRRGAGDAHKKASLARGQREAQFKMMTLQYAADFGFALEDYCLEKERR